MDDLIKSLSEEKQELYGKMERLSAFLQDPAKGVREKQILLLNMQFDFMSGYHNALSLRIEDLKKFKEQVKNTGGSTASA